MVGFLQAIAIILEEEEEDWWIHAVRGGKGYLELCFGSCNGAYPKAVAVQYLVAG